MADNDSGKKSGFGLILFILLIALLGGGAWYLNSTGQLAPMLASVTGEPMDVQDDAEADADVAAAETEEAAPETSAIVPLSALASVDSMLRERVLGFPGAPIKVSEHSSLTCSHCGQFHRETFEQFKSEYLVTGKASLVFSDFPLNAPALVASMVTRCVAEEHYFDMVQELFEKQDEWAYDTKYLDYLEDVAASYGLPEDLFEACTANNELRQGLLSQMQVAQTANNIRSTPTFVVNDIGQINGALPYEQFRTALEAAIAPAPAPTPAPVAEDAVTPSAGE